MGYNGCDQGSSASHCKWRSKYFIRYLDLLTDYINFKSSLVSILCGFQDEWGSDDGGQAGKLTFLES